MAKLLKIYSCYTCPNMEYISELDRWDCILTEEEIIEPELIADKCPLDDVEDERRKGMITELEEIKDGIIKYEYEIKEDHILITLRIDGWKTIVGELFHNPLKPLWIEGGGINAEMMDYCDSLNESLYDYVKHGNSVRKLFGLEKGGMTSVKYCSNACGDCPFEYLEECVDGMPNDEYIDLHVQEIEDEIKSVRKRMGG